MIKGILTLLILFVTIFGSWYGITELLMDKIGNSLATIVGVIVGFGLSGLIFKFLIGRGKLIDFSKD